MANIFYAIRSLFSGSGAPTRTLGLQSGAPMGSSDAAATVNFDSAMQVSAVWASVRILSETIASLPFQMFEITPQGRRLAKDHSLAYVLTKNPNQYQTRVEFWESLILNLAVSGNAYAIIQRSGKRIIGLLPISSQQVETNLLPDGTVTHTYTTGSQVRVYSGSSMLHIKLFGNGIVGMSPLAYGARSIGTAIAGEKRVSKIFANGAKPSGVLMIDKTLTAEQRSKIKENFAGLESGNDDRLFVLEAGMQYEQVSMSPQDIELLASRRFQIEDIGRFFGVPTILLNQSFGQSSLGSNVYEIISAFYKLNLRPYLEKIEASVKRWLLDEKDWDRYEFEFDFDALLRSDLDTRMKAYQTAINSGQMTPNEARRFEGLEGLPGGDQLLVQGAMIPILSAGAHLTQSEGSNNDTN